MSVFVPEELKAVKQKVDAAESPKVTVRTLLDWFDAKRRRPGNVARINTALGEVGLATDPDYEGAWIDGEITFVNRTSSAAPQPPRDAGSADSTDVLPDEPAYRLGKLDAANRPPVTVAPTDSLERAVTIMLTQGVSQLPVVTNARTIKGIISWKSIGSRLFMGCDCKVVQDCMEPHHELRDSDSLFDAIQSVSAHDCVIVRARDNAIKGIITASDLSYQFKLLAEPFLLLEAIEKRLRVMVQDRLSSDDFRAAKDPNDESRLVEGPEDLTLGEFVRLLENNDRWSRVNLPVERVEFVNRLKEIVRIRNDVVHFDPSPEDADDIRSLRRFNSFLARILAILAQRDSADRT